MPVYVGSSMSFASTTMGGSVEEEMAAFREVMAVVVDKVKEVRDRTGTISAIDGAM